MHSQNKISWCAYLLIVFSLVSAVTSAGEWIFTLKLINGHVDKI